jgi:DNA helicase II / ATP-dependent DNA helicase PcrA
MTVQGVASPLNPTCPVCGSTNTVRESPSPWLWCWDCRRRWRGTAAVGAPPDPGLQAARERIARTGSGPGGGRLTARERLATLLEDTEFVSAQQPDAVCADGNFFLLSRPGSGKTRTSAIRLAWSAVDSSGRRVAGTSYTNVAVEQIRATVRELGVVLDSSHFTGTIHEFLLRYVLYPFAAPILAWSRPIRLVDDDWRGWADVVFRRNVKLRLPIGKFHFRADGSLVARDAPLSMTREQATEEGRDAAARLKRLCAARGLVSLSDAMYYALAVLERDDRAVRAVAARFHEVIVDEAQDTSDVQLRTLELLHAGGLRSLVLVGDLDQSIYGFQGAAPELCRDLVERHGLRELPLTENFRSSQAICNVTCRFRGDRDPDRAVGRYRGWSIQPEILRYPPEMPGRAREFFAERLADQGIDSAEAVVLARGHWFADRLNGVRHAEIRPPVAALGALVAARTARFTLTKDMLGKVEDLLAELAWDTAAATLSEADRRRLRKATMRLVSELPALDRTLAVWVADARTIVGAVLPDLTDRPIHRPGDRVRSERGYEAINTMTAFGPSTTELEARTVHAVKGESHGAVLLVAAPAQGREVDQTALWSRQLVGHEVAVAEHEELRIAYVALTRAERYCAVALPDNSTGELLNAFLGAGFVLRR